MKLGKINSCVAVSCKSHPPNEKGKEGVKGKKEKEGKREIRFCHQLFSTTWKNLCMCTKRERESERERVGGLWRSSIPPRKYQPGAAASSSSAARWPPTCLWTWVASTLLWRKPAAVSSCYVLPLIDTPPWWIPLGRTDNRQPGAAAASRS